MNGLIPTPAARIAAFESLGFGLFLHYGLYSVLGRGEKPMCFEKIPPDVYRRELMPRFTAEKFSGRALARRAKEVGMKYACLTARHHDGFSLFDTCGLNDYDAPHAACGRDLIADFVEGCRAEGIVPFFYHTTLDWSRPDFNGDFPAYLDYLFASVELLCKNYGPVGGFWFDGNWSKRDADWREDEFYRMIRSYQPNAILINNTGVSRRGAVGNAELDVVTFENGRPDPLDRRGMEKYLAAEMCETMNDYWGYAADDCDYKSSAQLIESLCICRRAGANDLLNVGPMGDGSISPEQDALLGRIGRWLACTKAPIYTAKPCGVVSNGKSFGLRDENGKLWLFVFGLKRADANGMNGEAGNGPREFTGLDRRVKRIVWTDNGEELAFSQDGEHMRVECTGYPYGTQYVVRIAAVEED